MWQVLSNFLCPQVVYQANLGKLNPQAKSFQYDFPIDCSKVMDQQVWSQELSLRTTSHVHRMSCREASCIVWQNGSSWKHIEKKCLASLILLGSSMETLSFSMQGFPLTAKSSHFLLEFLKGHQIILIKTKQSTISCINCLIQK